MAYSQGSHWLIESPNVWQLRFLYIMKRLLVAGSF